MQLILKVPDEKLSHVCPAEEPALDVGQHTIMCTIRPKTEGICDACGEKLIYVTMTTQKRFQKRLDVYHEQTQPLIDYYKKAGCLVEMDGTVDIQVVFDNIIKVLEA